MTLSELLTGKPAAGAEPSNAELRARIAQLEAAVHALVTIAVRENPRIRDAAMPDRALKALWPFVTVDDVLGHPVRVGVGDR